MHGSLFRVVERSERRPSALEVTACAAFAAFVAVVAAVTAAQRAGVIPLRTIAASPQQVAAGKVWLLLTSGLLIQNPLALSLLSFAALGALTLAACGFRVLAWSALLGHVLSTLIVYGLLGLGSIASPEVFGSTWSAPDYGVSAISAAWLGAVAAVAWRRSDRPMERALVVAACVGVAAFGWMVRGHVNVLDSEHGVAFATGVVISWRALRATFLVGEASLRPG